jgi:acyl dehydratase
MGSTALSPKERWFEDFEVGEVFEFGDRLVTEDEIIDFARRYDPQPFHTDAAAAASSNFGGLVASGWMTAALLMREMCDHFIASKSAMGSPGVDELRWQRPVRGGDRLRVRVTVTGTRPSQTRGDRGVVLLRQEVLNQTGETVMSLVGRAMLRRRPGRESNVSE